MVTGTVLGDRYRIDERLASGGMGAVYRATDQKLDRPVAIKILKEQFAYDPPFVERFKREAQAAGALAHPNVAAVFDLGRDEDRYFIVMELVDGRDLARLLREEGPLPPERVVSLGAQIARALAHAHAAGVVHRDIKPGNVIVDAQDRVKVTDFGIARAAGQSTLTAAGSVLGTAEYISPEQAEGGQVGPSADIYSLGIVLYEMATGALPFTGESTLAVAMRHITDPMPRASQLASGVPAGLDAVIAWATQKDPNDRFVDAATMRRALQGVDEPEIPDATSSVAPSVWPIPGDRYDPAKLGRKVLVGVAALTIVTLVLFLARLQDRGSELSSATGRQSGVSASAGKEAPATLVLGEDIVGFPYEEVSARLSAAGLAVSRVDLATDDLEVGLVAESDPPPGSSVTEGDTITLFVSTGPEEDDAEEGDEDGDSSEDSDS